jgi:hypothetical protein
MKIFQFLILACVLLSSCQQSKDDNSKPDERKNNNIYDIPDKPCESVSWGTKPVITQGYSEPDHEKVIVETYVKNSNFDSIIRTFNLRNDAKIRDTQRQERSFSLPSEINSAVDIKIIIGRDEFLITEVKTGWVPRYGHEFIGYDCAIQNFLTNGEKDGGNIHLKNPSFKYPWEK